jgi:hypothetical protein
MSAASTSVDLVRATREQLDELDDLLERMLGLPVKPEPGASEPEPPRVEKQALPPREPRPGPTPALEKEPAPVVREDRPAQGDEQQDDNWVPLRSTWQPSPQTWGPLARTWRKLSAKEDVEMPEDAPTVPPARELTSTSVDHQIEDEPVRAELPKAPPAWDERPAFTSPKSLFPARDNDPVDDRSWAATREEPADHAGDTVKQTLADALARLRKSEAPPPKPLPRVPLWTWPLLAVDRGFEWVTLPLGPVGRWFRGTAGRELMAWLGVLAFLAAATLMALDGFGWTW